MGLQRYKEILQKPEKHLLKTAKDMLRCFFRQLYIIRVCKNTVSDTRVSDIPRPECQTRQDPDVRHAKTRVSDMPRPGCRTCQDPGVGHTKTRVSDIPRPGCRTYPVRQSGKLASQRESISVKRGENVRTNSRKRQAAKQKTDKMIQPSVFFCYFCIL